MVKSLALIHRKPGMSEGEFLRYWKEEHGPLAARLVPGLHKYVQNHPLKKPGSDEDYDGFTELWFDSLQAFENYAAWRGTSEGKALLDDESKFIDPIRTVRYIVEEHLVL